MRRLKIIAMLVFVGFVVVSGWLAYGWAKAFIAEFISQSVRANVSDSQPLPAATNRPLSAKSTMAAAFASGHLPEPLPIPTGDPDQAAEELAKKIAARGEQSTAALLTALQMAGFSIKGEDGSTIVESVHPGQGIVFEAWEVAAIAKLYGDGMEIKLDDMSNALSSSMTPLKDAPLAALLLDGLRTSANEDQPAKRFWAHLIAELGRHSGMSYDLLAQDVDPSTISLDAIQGSLVLRRLVADLMMLDARKSQETQLSPDWEGRSGSNLPDIQPALPSFSNGVIPLYRAAVWHPIDRPHLTLVQEGGDSKLPCTLAELAAQIMDASESLSGKGFDKLMEYLKEHGLEGAGKYGKATSVINALLAVIKLMAYYACLETDITMSGEPPLVRTQSIYQPGERRTLTGTVSENIGKWQAMNCVRIALNGAGIAFSLPNNGPQAGVEIQWVLVGGGVSVSHDTGAITWPFVEFVAPDGTPLIQDTVGTLTSNPTAPKTDEKGQATIDIEGMKQREELVNPSPVMKQAEVRFTCAPKPISMSQDVIDAVGNGYLGGPVGLIVGGPVEILLRSNIHFSKQLFIPVKDWQSCKGGWNGTISYTMTIHSSSDQGSADTHISNETQDYTEHGEVQLDGSQDLSGMSDGTFSGKVDARRHGADRWPAVGCSDTVDVTTTGSGAGKASVEITPQGNQYRIALAESGRVPLNSYRHMTTSCKGGPAPDQHTSGNTTLGFPPVTAEEDPKQPGVLHGSTTLKPGLETTITVEWNLRRCH